MVIDCFCFCFFLTRSTKYDKHAPGTLGEVFKAFDFDGDQTVSKAEFFKALGLDSNSQNVQLFMVHTFF